MKKLFCFLFIVSSLFQKAIPCTNFLITKGASADGSTMITYSADSHVLYGELYFKPAKNYPEGTMFDIYEWDTGKYLGKIKQAKHTFSVVGNINEHQVAIGETTWGGRPELVDTTGILDYGSLIYITLQRARTAREAIKIMTSLVAEYGYYSSGESISIADPNEVWFMEIIGKGPGKKGAVWVAIRIPDGYISGHANHARITTFPLNDTNNCLYAKDVITLAREKKYFNGKDNEFSFADAYDPLDFSGARFCEARVWAMFNRINKDMGKYLDYAMGYNLKNRMPLYIKPDKKLSVIDVMNLMRDHFEGTPMDMNNDIGAGPFNCPYRWRPLTFKVDSLTYFNERATSTQQTGFSFVAQCRNWLPNPMGGILWFGVDDTYSTVYSPMYCGIKEIPHSYAEGNGSIMEFSDNAAFWVFNQVSNFAYTRYRDIIPEIQKVQSELENRYVNEVKQIDIQSSSLFNSNPEKAIDIITDYSVKTGNYTVNRWKELYKYLFTKYMDGNIKTKLPNQRNPKVEQPGYGDKWNRIIVEKTGEKLLLKENNKH